jgi:glutathione S-transferase
MATPAVELIQFPYSHYNEKVRWALAFKRIPHHRRNLLPGPHAPTVLRLTRQTETPVVRFGEELMVGSARIIDELERRVPDPPLYPADAALRRRVLELRDWFDEQAGPMVRRALFSVLVRHPQYTCAMFSQHRGRPVRAAYRAIFPLTRIAMSRSMGIGDEASIAAGFAGTEAALERVTREVGPSGYLAGDRFTVADLTAAALLAPVADPPHQAMRRPRPVPDELVRWHERWAAHPAVAWVLRQYERHRPADG